MSKNSPKNHWQNYTHRNLWQHPLWAKFQESAGRKTFLVEVEKAQAQVVKHQLPMNLCWLEIPRGPLFESGEALKKLMEKVKHLAKKEKAIYVRLSPYQALSIKNLKLKIGPGHRHPEASVILDLSLSEEDLLKQMKPKGRYNIKVAKKHEVEVKPSDDVKTFYRLLVKTGGRDAFRIHPQRYYEVMLKSFGDHAQLLMAHKDGEPIAGGIFVYVEAWGIYYYGASNHDHRKLMAPYLLQWEAILEAKKRGCQFYDFLGIAPEGAQNHPWAGVTQFKKKFGGQVVHYPKPVEWTIRPFWHVLYKLRQKLR